MIQTEDLPELFANLSYAGLALASIALVTATLERVWTCWVLRPKQPAGIAAKGLFGLFAWVAGTAPLFGILGTTAGIQVSFRGGELDPEAVLSGIGLALWTTALGLLEAIAALSLRSMFHSRTASLWRRVQQA